MKSVVMQQLLVSLLGVAVLLPSIISASPYSFDEVLGVLEQAGIDVGALVDPAFRKSAVDISGDLSKVKKNCQEIDDLFGFYLEAHHKNDPKLMEAVDKALEEHGNLCRPTYMDEFEDLLEDGDFRAAQRKVAKLLDTSAMKAIFNETEPQRNVRKTNIIELVPLNLRKKVERKDSEFFERRCGTFVALSYKIFLPAKLDLVLEDEKISEINASKQFMDAWLKFRVCTNLLSLAAQ